MVIQNMKNVVKIKKIRVLAAIIAISLIIVALISDFFPLYIFAMSKYIYVGIFAGLLVIFFFIMAIYKFCYIYYCDDGNKIVFRYYPLQELNKAYKAIEIPKNMFIKFESVFSFYGKQESIILHQKAQKGVVKYPPVSISALSADDKIKLKNSLLKYSSSK